MSSDRLAVLAHELRSPVAALAAIAEAFPAADVSARLRLLELARAASQNVERLVLDASLASVRLRPLDAGAVVRDVAEAAALRGANVRADVDDELPLVAGDPERLRQALDNLVANAVGHAPPGTEVLVSASAGRHGMTVRLAVTDTGDGIAAEDVARVFEPGVRLTDERPGSGLGLAVVRAIAEAHGGSVEVVSAPGQGATFTLVLPASAAPA